jgi:pyrroline-5-carboxylate reductase
MLASTYFYSTQDIFTMKSAIIAIIGGGHMGRSLVGGLLADGYDGQKIWIAGPSQEKLNHLAQQFGVNTTTDNQAAVKNADVIIFCVKPQILQGVAAQLAGVIQKTKPLIVSVVTGVRVAAIQHWIGDQIAIVRAMPNTPALIGCGASGLYANKFVTQEQANNAESILRAVGVVVWLQDEKLVDVVTAISGSGPAYFFLIMEALQQAAERLGLAPEVARLLTLQTAFGAGRMALESSEELANLRRHVTSPGGTTEQAVRVLEEADIRGLLYKTALAAKNRAEQLANQHEASEP